MLPVNSQPPVGVIEGFFGPQWSWPGRKNIIAALKDRNDAYYIYAPKQDPYLRKRWKEDYPEDLWQNLLDLRKFCRAEGVAFGVGFSPFELHKSLNVAALIEVRAKIERLSELDLDYIGVFFDDMKTSPNLLKGQLKITETIADILDSKILFCPSYYSYDTLLDKVFGERPANYLEDLGKELPSEYEILWTGDKVLPDTITPDHLEEVNQVLQRRPFIWDNGFANDGPKNCKFLKLQPFTGRPRTSYQRSSGWALNPMNQAFLSEIVVRATLNTLGPNLDENGAFREALFSTCGEALATLINDNLDALNKVGLDNIENKDQLLSEFEKFDSEYAKEIQEWLKGNFIVGDECLTD